MKFHIVKGNIKLYHVRLPHTGWCWYRAIQKATSHNADVRTVPYPHTERPPLSTDFRQQRPLGSSDNPGHVLTFVGPSLRDASCAVTTIANQFFPWTPQGQPDGTTRTWDSERLNCRHQDTSHTLSVFLSSSHRPTILAAAAIHLLSISENPSQSKRTVTNAAFQKGMGEVKRGLGNNTEPFQPQRVIIMLVGNSRQVFFSENPVRRKSQTRNKSDNVWRVKK